MQLNLPIFPVDSRPINSILSVVTIDDFVYYFVNGNPIRTHPVGSITDFKFHIAEMIHLKICKKSEAAVFFNVSIELIKNACKVLKEEGIAGFYKDKHNGISASQMLPDRIIRIQESLDKGQSNLSIAKREGISEGTIRYNISIGKLKKKVK